MMTHHNIALVINGEYLVSGEGQEQCGWGNLGEGNILRTGMQA